MGVGVGVVGWFWWMCQGGTRGRQAAASCVAWVPGSRVTDDVAVAWCGSHCRVYVPQPTQDGLQTQMCWWDMCAVWHGGEEHQWG